MKLNEYNRVSRHWRVKYQKMPDVWQNRLPSEEEIWIGGAGGWQHSSSKAGSVFRHYKWHREENFPKIFREMMDHHYAEDISMFVGSNENEKGSLDWHVDDYHVWAFNIEGTTEWEWFDLLSGDFKKQVVETGYILTMPLGISHRVKVLSENRTSISIITRYGAGLPTMKPEK